MSSCYTPTPPILHLSERDGLRTSPTFLKLPLSFRPFVDAVSPDLHCNLWMPCTIFMGIYTYQLVTRDWNHALANQADRKLG